MNITLDTLESKANSFVVYQLGKLLSETGKVQMEKKSSIWKGNFTLLGIVEDEDEYHAKISVVNNEISTSSCTCHEFVLAGKLCTHCIALLHKYLKEQKNNSDRNIPTSLSAKMLINEYAKVNLSQIVNENLYKKIQISSKLIIKRKDIEVEFRIGNEKKYIIKDLKHFYISIKEKERLDFGKNLSFTPTFDVFDEQSLPLVKQIMKIVSLNINKNELGYIQYSKGQMRKLELNYGVFDDILPLLKEQTILLEQNGLEKEVIVKEENPIIFVKIEKKGKKWFEVSVDKNIIVYLGISHAYVIKDNVLYICDETYKNQVGTFLNTIMNENISSRGAIQINEREMYSFCIEVLEKIQGYTQVDVEKADIEPFIPEKMVTQFYLDYSNDAVTCKIIHLYGEQSINPLEDNHKVEIKRNYTEESRVANAIQKYFSFKNEAGYLYTEHSDEIFKLITYGVSELSSLGEVFVTDAFDSIKTYSAPKVNIGVSILDDFLKFHLDTTDFNIEELSEMIKSYEKQRKYYRLKNGSFISFDNNQFQKMYEFSKEILRSNGNLLSDNTVPKYRAFYMNQLMNDMNEDSYAKSKEFQRFIHEFEEKKEISYKIPNQFETILREYQKEGFFWMKKLKDFSFGGILADDMGLGKTVQTIAFLVDETKNNGGTSLIVCPASLIYNWESECNRFAPHLKIAIVTGTKSERKDIIKNYANYNIVITSYDLLRRDLPEYESCQFHTQIIDEAQYIKNQGTQNSKSVKKIHSKYRFALTGTPIENRLSELWSIFDYLMPGFLYSYHKFKEEIERPIVKDNSIKTLQMLHKKIAPFILRRLKTDVLQELPEKIEKVIYAGLEGTQKALYQGQALELKKLLLNQTDTEYENGKIQILSYLLRLRQICCDPKLCYNDYEKESAKLDTCLELIEGGIRGNHKILLFSQFTSMLDIIKKKLEEKNISYYCLTGATSKEERIELVNKFQKDDVPIFLISLKAGGTGLNLTAADMVIHYDPWWNVAAQNQATDRSHRIGQEKIVTVYQLIAKNTLEEKILHLQKAKANLADQILSVENKSLSSLTKEELLSIISE